MILASCDPALVPLFTPPHPHLGRYEVCASSDADPGRSTAARSRRSRRSTPSARPAPTIGRRWPGCTAAPACRSRAAGRARGDRFESITLLSPYPDASLTHLLPGTLEIRFVAILSPIGMIRQDSLRLHARWLLVCAARLAPRPDAAVGADRARRRPRHRRRRRLGRLRLRRPGLLQLHRLRALDAAAAPPRSDGGGQGRRRTSRCSARSARENLGRVRPYALVPAHPPVDDARLRHPGRPHAADLRRLRAAHLRHRQPAHRLPARVSVPDVAAARRACRRAPTNCCGCAAAAGCRASRSATRRPTTACRSSARSAGTPACRCTRTIGMLSATGGGDGRHARRTRCSRDDNDGRQLAGPRRAASGRRPDPRRLARARPVRQRRGGARRASATATTASFTQTRVGRRRRVLARLLPGPRSRRSSAAGSCRSRRRRAPLDRRRRSRAVSTSVEGRYKLAPGLLRRGARRSPRVQRR